MDQPYAAPTGWRRWRAYLPEGLELPTPTWESRHRVVLAVLWAHAIVLPVFGVAMGWGLGLALGEGAILAALAILAMAKPFNRRFKSTVASLGCVTSSAVLTQFSGGFIEAHFHFFIIVALVALYQDWVPFLLAIIYVAVDHGVVGSIAPSWVYNHPLAIEHPWWWAMVHAAAILAECAALLAFWSNSEKAHSRNDLVLKSAGDGILGVDPEGRVTFANPAAGTLLGGTRDLLTGGRLDEWLPQWRSAAGGGPVRIERGGRTLECMLNPATRAGAAEGFVVTIRDVTSIRMAAEARQRAEVLDEQNRFKTQLLNTASHELNTPIGVLRLQMKLLETDLKDEGPSVREGLSRVRRNVERLANLVQDTLDVARLESGRMPLSLEEGDLGCTVAEACESLLESARQKEIAVAFDATPVPAAFDPNRIAQVVVNLVANAIKFTPPHGRVTVATRLAGDKARVEVSDTGPGVEESELPMLFKPFSQLPRMQHHSGTGLGLYICKGIIEQHGGRIWCEGKPAPGATFVFEVPLSATPAPSVTLLEGERTPDAPTRLAMPARPAAS